MNKLLDTIRDMWRTIRMWRLMRKLQKYCLTPNSNQIDVKHIYKPEVKQITFTKWLAINSAHPFRLRVSHPCPSCKSEEYKKYQSKHGKKIARLINVYSMIISLCEKDGYLSARSINNDDSCENRLITLTEKGNEQTGIFDLIEMILVKYKLTWTILLVPILTFVLGIYLS